VGKTPENYWKKRSEMTPEELEAARAYDRAMRLKHLPAKLDRNRAWYQNKSAEEKKAISDRVSEKRRQRKAEATPEQWAAMQAVWKDVRARLRNRMRGRLRECLKAVIEKKVSASSVVAKASVERILAQLKPGMTTDNFGTVWNLDHVIPCIWFDVSRADHQEACLHECNVRPEFASENKSRSFAVSAEHFEYVLARCPVRLQHVYEEIRSKIRARGYPERLLRRVTWPI
jgi:hypothetical protein